MKMNNLIDLKRQLSVIGIKSKDQKGNYRSAADIYKDIGVVYQKFYNAGVSISEMKLLDRVCYDIVTDWDRLVEDEGNKSCSNRSQTLENERSRVEYKEMVGVANQSYIQLMRQNDID